MSNYDSSFDLLALFTSVNTKHIFINKVLIFFGSDRSPRSQDDVRASVCNFPQKNSDLKKSLTLSRLVSLQGPPFFYFCQAQVQVQVSGGSVEAQVRVRKVRVRQIPAQRTQNSMIWT